MTRDSLIRWSCDVCTNVVEKPATGIKNDDEKMPYGWQHVEVRVTRRSINMTTTAPNAAKNQDEGWTLCPTCANTPRRIKAHDLVETPDIAAALKDDAIGDGPDAFNP